MAKLVHDDVLDAALNFIKNNANEMTVCSGEPATYADAHTTLKLADVVMASGDFTVGEGDASGRKVAVAQKANVTVDATGTAVRVCLNDTSGSKLLYKTECTSQSLTSGNTVTFPTWDIEIADPT